MPWPTPEQEEHAREIHRQADILSRNRPAGNFPKCSQCEKLLTPSASIMGSRTICHACFTEMDGPYDNESEEDHD